MTDLTVAVPYLQHHVGDRLAVIDAHDLDDCGHGDTSLSFGDILSDKLALDINRRVSRSASLLLCTSPTVRSFSSLRI
jgi:hypothetical protein